MEKIHEKYYIKNVLLIGQGRLLASIGACLALSGSSVTVVSREPEQDYLNTQKHINQSQKYSGKELTGAVRFAGNLNDSLSPDLVILTGYTDIMSLRSMIRNIESHFEDDIIISVATDHIPLSVIQKNAERPGNILVVNWTEPAHTTYFLEIVHNDTTNLEHVSKLYKRGKEQWGKDPYFVHSEIGIKGRLNAAMLREALFLVEEGYASMEDIDRACRNDAGTYLPFSGHFKYMDLMGTYAYGVVMKELNKELSNTKKVPAFFERLLESGRKGMADGSGLYKYSDEEVKEWESKAREFSFEVRELMEKYS